MMDFNSVTVLVANMMENESFGDEGGASVPLGEDGTPLGEDGSYLGGDE